MTEKKFKTKDMLIAIFCTVLAVLCIVFYFLPAFNVKHRVGPQVDYEQINYSAWEMTKATFSNTKVIGSNMEGLMYIKDTYAFPILASGILMPLGIICTITTAVFSYLSWLKNEDFKKYCFLFSLVGMMFTTVTLICTWFVAIMIRDGNNFDFFNYNLKGSISYASFVSLILSFVVAIIACAYNYFLDNFDDEEEEEDEEDEEPKKPAKKEQPVVEEKVEEPVVTEAKPKAEVTKTATTKKPSSTKTTTTKKPATKTTTATKAPAKKPSAKASTK